MDNRTTCPHPGGHDYIPDQPPVKRGDTATATCKHCHDTITATR